MKLTDILRYLKNERDALDETILDIEKLAKLQSQAEAAGSVGRPGKKKNATARKPKRPKPSD